MPVHRVGRDCWQWGSHGKVYCGQGARKKAERQGRAAYSHGYRGRKVREVSGVWYHGSPERFERFETRVRRTFGTGASETPIFLSRDVDFARLYAGPNGYVYEVRPHVAHTFDTTELVISERYWPPSRDALTEEGQALYDDLAENVIFTELIRYGTTHEDDDEWAAFHDSAGTFASILREDYDVMETTEMKRWLLGHGYDSFFVRGDGPRNLAVFDPSKIEILGEVE